MAGRKPKITDDMLPDLERRHLVGGESIRSLAEEIGVDEAALRRRINPQKKNAKDGDKSLMELAKEKIALENAAKNLSATISALPLARQATLSDLTRKLTNITGHLLSAAEYGASTAHRLHGIAAQQVQKIDDFDPLSEDGVKTLQGINACVTLANKSAEVGINLIRANKEAVEDINKQENASRVPSLSDFYRS